MIKISEVWINRAEGRAAECGPRSFPDIQSAEHYLREAARTAPESGYDKCDFKITFTDGDTYEGRIDLQRSHRHGYSIASHVIDFLTFIAGERRPLHMPEERYRAYLAEPHVAAERAPALAFLARYRVALEG